MTTTLDNTCHTDKVKGFLSMIKRDIDNSHDMYSRGINTEFSSRIEKFVENPLKGLIDTYNNLHDQVRENINSFAVEYFKIHRSLIEKAFTLSESNNLTYYLVLKEDNSDNRDKFFAFLSGYEILGIQDKLPIYIRFLPKRVADKSGLKEEIVFS